MKHLSIAMLLLVIPYSHTSQATGPDIDCSDTPKSGYADAYCAGKDYEAADAKLNSAYKKLQALLDKGHKEKLAAIQRAWIAHRDATCDFETEPAADTTGLSTYSSQCLARLTQCRVTDLESAIEAWSP